MDGGTHETVIETRSGPVRGEHKRGAFRVKGIPFAAPPTDELRFQAPQPPDPWTVVHDGTGRFPIAPQPIGGMEAAAGGAGGAEQSEAGCLTLNVWTPAVDDGRRPVMLWIHGGGFLTGAGTVPWYDGSALAQRGVVVVTVNYRLGALGFLELGSVFGREVADSGNAGLLDQVAALRWVRDNISQFGGDPQNVTIFGESAGGMSVATLLGTPAASGLFHKAIPQSGAAAHVSQIDDATVTAEKVLTRLGVDSLAALRRVPAAELVGAQGAAGADFSTGGRLPFQPVVGGATLPRPPLDAVRDGHAAGVAVLAGSNRHEMRLFTALAPQLVPTEREEVVRLLDARGEGRGREVVEHYEAAGASTLRDVLERATTDAVFRIPALELLEAQAKHAPTYGYEFHFESSAFGGVLGAAHAVEIPFCFDNLDAGGASFFTGEPTDAMRGLATRMADAWTSFARTGVPAADGLPEWPTHGPAQDTMILDVDAAVVRGPATDELRLWRGGE